MAQTMMPSHFYTAGFLCALFLAASVGCGEKPRAQHISAKLSVISYAQARTRFTAGMEKNLNFPVLEIFNGDGSLIYRNQDEIRNAGALEHVLASISTLPPLQHAPRLADILDTVPEFKPHEQEVLSHHKPVVLSVDMEGCGACRIQASWLEEERDRLLRQSIDVLEIHVSAPSL